MAEVASTELADPAGQRRDGQNRTAVDQGEPGVVRRDRSRAACRCASAAWGWCRRATIEKAQTVAYQVTQRLRDKTCTVIVTAKSGGKKVEAHWTFTIDETGAARSGRSSAAPLPRRRRRNSRPAGREAGQFQTPYVFATRRQAAGHFQGPARAWHDHRDEHQRCAAAGAARVAGGGCRFPGREEFHRAGQGEGARRGSAAQRHARAADR